MYKTVFSYACKIRIMITLNDSFHVLAYLYAKEICLSCNFMSNPINEAIYMKDEKKGLWLNKARRQLMNCLTERNLA